MQSKSFKLFALIIIVALSCGQADARKRRRGKGKAKKAKAAKTTQVVSTKTKTTQPTISLDTIKTKIASHSKKISNAKTDPGYRKAIHKFAVTTLSDIYDAAKSNADAFKTIKPDFKKLIDTALKKGASDSILSSKNKLFVESELDEKDGKIAITTSAENECALVEFIELIKPLSKELYVYMYTRVFTEQTKKTGGTKFEKRMRKLMYLVDLVTDHFSEITPAVQKLVDKAKTEVGDDEDDTEALQNFTRTAKGIFPEING